MKSYISLLNWIFSPCPRVGCIYRQCALKIMKKCAIIIVSLDIKKADENNCMQKIHPLQLSNFCKEM